MMDESLQLEIFKNAAYDRERWLGLRRTCITSTDVAAVVGLGKYRHDKWTVYMQKRGEIDDTFELNERIEAGMYLEPAIAKWASERLGITLRRLPHFYRTGSMGSSFDYEVQHDGSEYDGWLAEIKNVDGLIFRDQWETDESGALQPPEHIAIQVQAELEVSRRPGAILIALVGGNSLQFAYVPRDEEIGVFLRSCCDVAMEQIQNGVEPKATADDHDAIVAYYSKATKGRVEDVAGTEVAHQIQRYYEYGQQMAELTKRREAIKVDVLQEIGDAWKVMAGDGFALDVGLTTGADPTVITEDMVGTTFGGRKGFRRFVVRRLKEGK